MQQDQQSVELTEREKLIRDLFSSKAKMIPVDIVQKILEWDDEQEVMRAFEVEDGRVEWEDAVGHTIAIVPYSIIVKALEHVPPGRLHPQFRPVTFTSLIPAYAIEAMAREDKSPGDVVCDLLWEHYLGGEPRTQYEVIGEARGE